MKKTSNLFAALAAALLCTGIAFGDPVPIADHSFETNPDITAAGGWSNEIGPDWNGTNGTNDGSAFEEWIDGFSADGTNHVGMAEGYMIWQDLTDTYQANTIYTLTVAIGNRDGHTNLVSNESTYGLGLNDGTVLAGTFANAGDLTGPGSFTDAPSLVFDTTSNPGIVGQSIRVGLQAGGLGRSHFDNVRLDAAPVPEPAAGVLAFLSLMGVMAFRRR